MTHVADTLLEWPRVRLGDVLSLEYGKSLPAYARDPRGDFPVAGSNGPDGKHSSALAPSPGIVVGRKGSAGKIYWYEDDFWPIDTTYYVAPKLSLDMRWTYYLLSRLRLDRLATTTGVPGLNRNDAYSLDISLPPLSEQRRIAEILDQADHLRHLRADADAKAERILPALFIKMFGDPARNPMGWPVRPLRSFLSSVERRDPVKCQEEQFVYVDIAGIDGATGRIVSTKKMLGHEAPSRARQLIRASDVLVSTVRPYLQATAMVPEELDGQIGSTGFCVLRSATGAGHGYLYALSRMSWFTEQLNSRARGASYPAVTDRDIWDLPVPLPGDFALLSYADAMVEKAMEIQEKQRRSSERLQAIFKGLLHRAFTGDLTASWRQARKKELLQEMEQQATELKKNYRGIRQ